MNIVISINHLFCFIAICSFIKVRNFDKKQTYDLCHHLEDVVLY